MHFHEVFLAIAIAMFLIALFRLEGPSPAEFARMRLRARVYINLSEVGRMMSEAADDFSKVIVNDWAPAMRRAAEALEQFSNVISKIDFFK